MLSDSQKAGHIDLVLHKEPYHHLQRMINIIIDQPSTQGLKLFFLQNQNWPHQDLVDKVTCSEVDLTNLKARLQLKVVCHLCLTV